MLTLTMFLQSLQAKASLLMPSAEKNAPIGAKLQIWLVKEVLYSSMPFGRMFLQGVQMLGSHRDWVLSTGSLKSKVVCGITTGSSELMVRTWYHT